MTIYSTEKREPDSEAAPVVTSEQMSASLNRALNHLEQARQQLGEYLQTFAAHGPDGHPGAVIDMQEEIMRIQLELQGLAELPGQAAPHEKTPK